MLIYLGRMKNCRRRSFPAEVSLIPFFLSSIPSMWPDSSDYEEIVDGVQALQQAVKQ